MEGIIGIEGIFLGMKAGNGGKVTFGTFGPVGKLGRGGNFGCG